MLHILDKIKVNNMSFRKREPENRFPNTFEKAAECIKWGNDKLAKERRRIKLSEIIKSVAENDSTSEKYKSILSKKVIEPLLEEINKKCVDFFDGITVDEICKNAKHKKIQKIPEEKVDFVI